MKHQVLRVRDTSTGSIRSVEKAIDIIEVLSTESQGLALVEIARRLRINESTVHHLLATLRRRGLVDQDQQTKVYRLGYRLIGLVNGFLVNVDLYSAGLGPIRELRDRSGETSYLTVVHDRELVSVTEIVGWKPIQARRTPMRGQTCLHSTASGKVWLAHLPPDTADSLLASLTLTKYTSNTFTDPGTLQAELAEIRRQGYALDREENIDGVMCIAAPVLDRHGNYVASASVAFPRAEMDRVAELIPMVVDAAAAISMNLGCVTVDRSDRSTIDSSIPVHPDRDRVSPG